MPRLPPSLFWRANREISPLAAQLLPACRDLQSTANELRWIREHVQDTKSPILPGLRVWELVEQRSKGVPLQYVLGSQPFGHLNIKCRPGVLIPRPETEAYTLHLATLLTQSHPPPPSLNILDLCTGTGCIPLLLLHSLQSTLPQTTPITIHGVDISPAAISLARKNQTDNPPPSRSPSPSPSPSPHQTLTFTKHDIFSPTLLPTLYPNQTESKTPQIDLLVSNPPYISPADFARLTARAVRNHEPRLALVPSLDHDGHADRRRYDTCRPEEDVFYARLLEITAAARPRRVLMEVGGWAQAVRVAGMVLRGGEDGDLLGGYEVEVWRDEPAASSSSSSSSSAAAGKGGEKVEVAGREVVVRGEGRGRAVYLRLRED